MAGSKPVPICPASVAAVAATVIVIAWFGIGAVTPTGVAIDGPTLTVHGSAVSLSGHVNGAHQAAYWTDEQGRRTAMPSDAGVLSWNCPTPGRFTISLVEVMDDGEQQQARHDLMCV